MTEEVEGMGNELTCTVCNKVVLRGTIRDKKFVCRGCIVIANKKALKEKKAAERAELDIKITERITLCKSKNWDGKVCKNCADLELCKLI